MLRNRILKLLDSMSSFSATQSLAHRRARWITLRETPLLFRSEAVAYLLNCPGTTACGKEALGCLSQSQFNSTQPSFWPARDSVEESSKLKPKQTFFTQGDPADSVFYLQKGRARVTVVSKNGKEATITLLLRWRFCRRRVARGGAWAAFGDGHCHYRLHCAQDREG